MIAIISNINNIKMKSIVDMKYCSQGYSCTTYDFIIVTNLKRYSKSYCVIFL